MGSPVTIGALSTIAPPGEARSARAHVVRDDRAGLDDRALIDAVRAGNLHAFGTLYERHVAAVRGLARRLCGNSTDADDVVADVFTNTLRAIKSGRGPRDDLRPYVLTAARHTVIKLRTRRDSARAIPTADEQLDLPVTDDSFAHRTDGVDTIGAAFVQLPDRFRNVLWLSCVEDLPPAEVGRHTDLSVGAVSSLTLRARRVLARRYLMSRISQPIVSPDCVTIRDLLPAIVRHEAAAGTIVRVDRHLVACCECREAFDDMQSLAGSLRTYPWFAAALAWLRALATRVAPEAFGGLGGAAALAPMVVTAVAVLTLATGDAPTPAPLVPQRSATATTPIAPPEPLPLRITRSRPAPALAPPVVADRVGDTFDHIVDDVTATGTRPTTALRERDVPTPMPPVLEPVTQPVTEIVEVAPAALQPVIEPLTTTVSTTLDAVDELGQQIASTADSIAGASEQLLGDLDQVVVDVLETTGADQLAATVAPVLDDATELVTSGFVEPVTGLVGDTVVDTTTLVTDTTSGLLGLTPRR